MRLRPIPSALIVASAMLYLTGGVTPAGCVEGAPRGCEMLAEKTTSEGPSRLRAGHGSPSVEQVLKRYIEAVGGRDAIEKLKTRTIKGSFTKDLHWDDPPFENYRIVIFAESPEGFLIDEHRPGARRREGFDGNVDWVQDENGFEVQDKFYLRKLACVCDPRGALRMERYFPGLSVNYEESGEGSAFYVLDPDALPREHYALYFDKRTGLLAHIGYHWDVEDYKEVDGVLLPQRVVAGRKGGSCTYELDEVTHNTPMPNSIFAPPGGSAGRPR